MQLPNFGEHNKAIYIALIGGAVVLGLYLRRRATTGNSVANAADGSSDMPNTPDISGNALDPYSSMGSGSADASGGSIPGPAGPTGPAGPRGPRGKTGHTKNQHHGNNSGGHGGKGTKTTVHHHHRKVGTLSPHVKPAPSGSPR